MSYGITRRYLPKITPTTLLSPIYDTNDLRTNKTSVMQGQIIFWLCMWTGIYRLLMYQTKKKKKKKKKKRNGHGTVLFRHSVSRSQGKYKSSLKYNNNHYENMPIQIYWNFYHQKMIIFRWKILIFFISLLKNIDCGYSLEPPRRGRGGSNEYPQFMFLSRDQKNNVYPCKPQFYYIKVGFKGVKII